MSKIINGKKYDITTAKEVGYASHGGRSDFSFYEETLYLKRTGEFFLYGSGNAASRYSKQIEQNSWSGGSKIIPLSYESARKWAEENLSAEGYEAIFGEVCEDDSKHTLTINLTASAIESAKRLASQRGTSLSALIEGLILREI